MPTYNYFCPDLCGASYQVLVASMEEGPPTQVFCPVCVGRGGVAIPLKRDYQADNIAIAAVPQATYVPAVGAEVSDPRQMTRHLKRMTEESEDRLGYTPKLRARHPSELAADPPPPPNPVAEARLQAAREARASRGADLG